MNSSEHRPTKIIRVDTASPDRDLLAEAVDVLDGGGLVAFPTETVYGLGADARDEEAVRGIFRAKGRPPTHPLIVHVPDAAAAEQLAARWDERARALAEAFWPGPLTLIVPRSEAVPDVVTGGLETVGLRVPADPVALALLQEAQMPLAAPSANRHQGVSPTRAAHVARSLGDSVDVIVDGGPTEVGIESTVLSLAVDPPVILRPGRIGRERLREVLDGVEYGDEQVEDDERERPSPGMAGRHYAPDARVVLAERSGLAKACRSAGGEDAQYRVGWLVIDAEPPSLEGPSVVERMAEDPEQYASRLYEALHRMEAQDCDLICIEAPPRTEKWRAVLNRLQRAAG